MRHHKGNILIFFSQILASIINYRIKKFTVKYIYSSKALWSIFSPVVKICLLEISWLRTVTMPKNFHSRFFNALNLHKLSNNHEI